MPRAATVRGSLAETLPHTLIFVDINVQVLNRKSSETKHGSDVVVVLCAGESGHHLHRRRV